MSKTADSFTGTECWPQTVLIVIVLSTAMHLTVKGNIHFIKSQPSSTHLSNILCDKMGNMAKAVAPQTEVGLLP